LLDELIIALQLFVIVTVGVAVAGICYDSLITIAVRVILVGFLVGADTVLFRTPFSAPYNPCVVADILFSLVVLTDLVLLCVTENFIWQNLPFLLQLLFKPTGLLKFCILLFSIFDVS